MLSLKSNRTCSSQGPKITLAAPGRFSVLYCIIYTCLCNSSAVRRLWKRRDPQVGREKEVEVESNSECQVLLVVGVWKGKWMAKRYDWDQGRLEGDSMRKVYCSSLPNAHKHWALVETGVVNSEVHSLEVTLEEPIRYTQIGKLNKSFLLYPGGFVLFCVCFVFLN